MKSNISGVLFAFFALILSSLFANSWGIFLGGIQTFVILGAFYSNKFIGRD